MRTGIPQLVDCRCRDTTLEEFNLLGEKLSLVEKFLNP